MVQKALELFAIIVVYSTNEIRFCRRGRRICSLLIDPMEGSAGNLYQAGLFLRNVINTVARRFGIGSMALHK